MSKSITEIANICEKKVMMILLSELPTPECAQKKKHNDWKIEEVKKELCSRFGGLGITVKIDV